MWEKKGNSTHKDIGSDSLWDLIIMNGYDSGADGISFFDWNLWIQGIKAEIPNYANVSSWLDAGCGSGAFLFSQDNRIELFGFDYSATLIERAGQFFRASGKPAQLIVGDITDSRLSLPQTDIISCVSSLQYVPEKIGLLFFGKMLDFAQVGVLIAENPNKKFQEVSQQFRSGNLNYDDDEKYNHTYYAIEDFNQIAAQRGFKSIKVHSKLGKQSSYRWSMYYEKISQREN